MLGQTLRTICNPIYSVVTAVACKESHDVSPADTDLHCSGTDCSRCQSGLSEGGSLPPTLRPFGDDLSGSRLYRSVSQAWAASGGAVSVGTRDRAAVCGRPLRSGCSRCRPGAPGLEIPFMSGTGRSRIRSFGVM